MKVIADFLSRGHTVHGALKADVHQDQVGMQLGRQLDRLLPKARHANHGVPKESQPILNVPGDDPVVLDDKNRGCVHERESSWQRAGKRMVKVVPPSRSRPRVPLNCSVRSATSCRPSESEWPGTRSGGSPTPLSDTTKI